MIRARPEDWYATRKKADGITLISEPFIRSFTAATSGMFAVETATF